MREKPKSHLASIFELRTEQLEELGRWFQQLAQASDQYVARVWEICARSARCPADLAMSYSV
jgi:hypothetical protein